MLKRLIVCFVSVLMIISLSTSSISAQDDFKIIGPLLNYISFGEEFQLIFVTSGIPYMFTSTNPVVATVDQNGLLRGIRNGSSVISMRSLDSSLMSTIIVYVNYGIIPNTFTVSYVPGTHGAFAVQSTKALVDGDITPAFSGTPTGGAGYIFAGWDPAPTDTVTGSATYIAQWTEIKLTPLSLNVINGEEYLVPLYFKDLGAGDIAIKVTYDDTRLQLLDYNAQAAEKDNADSSKFEIISNDAGDLKLNLKPASSDTSVTSGEITVLKFKALSTDDVTIAVETI